MAGRPTLLTPEVEAFVLDAVRDGVRLQWFDSDEAKERAAEKGLDCPAACTVFRWRQQNADFDAKFTAANRALAERIFMEVDDLADDVKNKRTDPKSAQAIFAIKRFQLETLNRRRFGRHVEVEAGQSLGDLVRQAFGSGRPSKPDGDDGASDG